MATSGSKTVTITNWNSLKFSWSISSQSIADNNSTVKWTMHLIATSSGNFQSTADKKWSVTINGTTYSGTNKVGIANNETKLLASGTVIIPHNPDGTKTFSYSFSQRIDIIISGEYIGFISGNGSDTLDTIPRISQPSCITWPEHTQNVGEFGDTISIHMNRMASVFTHTVRYQFGKQSGTIATGVETGTTWTIPLSLMNLIPNATKGSGTIFVDTYDGETFVGTKYCGFTATVPASVKPSCSMTLEDITEAGEIYGQPVQSLSKIKATINATLAYESPIVAYSISIDGKSYNTATATTGALSIAGDSPVVVKVTDQRGRSGSASYTMKVLAYNPPNIPKLTVHRCDEDGTENEQGEYIKVTFDAAVTSLLSKNTAAYKLRYKRSTAAQYTEVALSELNNVYAVSGATRVFEADGNSSYDVEIVATDRHHTDKRGTSVSTAFMLMNWGKDGTSIGLLKAAERPGAVDVGGDVYLNGHALYGAHGMADTRDTNETPEWYMSTHGRGVVWEFKELTVVGFTAPSSKYGPVQTIIPWKDASGGLPRQVVYEGRTRWTRIANSADAWGAWLSDALIAYPVGSIYIAYNHTDPGTLFGGTWARITNAFLWAADATGTIGQIGGEKTHTLTTAELPKHTHGSVYSQNAAGTKTQAWFSTSGDKLAYGTVEAGGGEAHNNMPPYIQVSIWRRTA